MHRHRSLLYIYIVLPVNRIRGSLCHSPSFSNRLPQNRVSITSDDNLQFIHLNPYKPTERFHMETGQHSRFKSAVQWGSTISRKLRQNLPKPPLWIDATKTILCDHRDHLSKSICSDRIQNTFSFFIRHTVLLYTFLFIGSRITIDFLGLAEKKLTEV